MCESISQSVSLRAHTKKSTDALHGGNDEEEPLAFCFFFSFPNSPHCIVLDDAETTCQYTCAIQRRPCAKVTSFSSAGKVLNGRRKEVSFLLSNNDVCVDGVPSVVYVVIRLWQGVLTCCPVFGSMEVRFECDIYCPLEKSHYENFCEVWRR